MTWVRKSSQAHLLQIWEIQTGPSTAEIGYPDGPIYCRDRISRWAHLLLAPFPTCGRGSEIPVSLPYLIPWRNGSPGSWPESKHADCGPSQGLMHHRSRYLIESCLAYFAILFESFTNLLSEQILVKPSIIPEVCFERTHQRQAYKSEHLEKPRQESKCDSAKKQRPSCPTTLSRRNHVCFLRWGIWDTKKVPIITYTSTKKVDYSIKVRTWPHLFPLAALAITWMNIKLLVNFSDQSQGLMVVVPNWDHTHLWGTPGVVLV